MRRLIKLLVFVGFVSYLAGEAASSTIWWALSRCLMALCVEAALYFLKSPSLWPTIHTQYLAPVSVSVNIISQPCFQIHDCLSLLEGRMSQLTSDYPIPLQIGCCSPVAWAGDAILEPQSLWANGYGGGDIPRICSLPEHYQDLWCARYYTKRRGRRPVAGWMVRHWCPTVGLIAAFPPTPSNFTSISRLYINSERRARVTTYSMLAMRHVHRRREVWPQMTTKDRTSACHTPPRGEGKKFCTLHGKVIGG